MNLDDYVRALKIAMCDANTVSFAENSFEMGAEWQKEQCALFLEDMATRDKLSNYYKVAAVKIREMK